MYKDTVKTTKINPEQEIVDLTQVIVIFVILFLQSNLFFILL
jgi:hypothetical protein